ncbi:MAG TPA: hypothetical protein VIU12_08030 [Chryseolinea sp.]
MTRNYQNQQHVVYARMLTPDEKILINRKGEITKNIELYDPLDMSLWHGMLKGTLRILRTENPEVFTFVEIGQWVTLTRATGQMMTNYHVRDTTLNDSLGNTVSKVSYQEDQLGKYSLKKKCTSKTIDHQFIQHFEIFRDTSLVEEFDMKILDHAIPKSDSRKRKIMIGTYNVFLDGKLALTRIYDCDGNLMKESKRER